MNLLDFSDKKNKMIPLERSAPEYLQGLKELVNKSPYYPRFHLAPPHGLMNDPNGLCQIDGWYHIFYQWFPLGPVHGLKHWYHLKTRDFVHYVDYGPALFPDTELDGDGCFTGVAHEENGRWKLYYTGVKDGVQQVCRIPFDGENGFGCKELCVPFDPNLTSREFRDPFFYQDDYLLVGAQSPRKKGMIAVFQRKDEGFCSLGHLKIPDSLSGCMVECPNLLKLDEQRDLLMFSPMGVNNLSRYSCRNVFSVLYGIGTFDPKGLGFECEEYRELDSGFDFYAPQLFRDEQGRLLLLGWLGNSKCVYPSDHEQWAHMMTIPRQIECVGNQLRQKPAEELKALRGAPQPLMGEQPLDVDCFELELALNQRFAITLYNQRGEYLVFRGDEEEYCLDRGHTTHLYNEQYGFERYARRNRNNAQNLRVFVDRSAIELFAEDGAVTFTARFYLDEMSGMRCEGVTGNFYPLASLELRKPN